MRIGEACNITGLTERTIRFYVEKLLLRPQSSERNGRVYFNFQDTDIEQLRKISTLRKAGFSIEDIAEMERDAGRIGALLSAHIAEVREKEKEYAGILNALSHAEGGQFASSGALADALTQGVRAMPLPRADLDPDFARFDSETPEERERGYADFLVQQRVREKTAVILRPLKIAGLVVCATALLLLVAYIFSCIPAEIDKTYNGVDFRVGESADATPDRIHVYGKLYRRLFQEPIFKGWIELESTPFTRSYDVDLHFYYGLGNPAWLVYSGIHVDHNGSSPYLESFAMAWTNDRFDYLILNLYDKVGNNGTLGNRVVCSPAKTAEEGMRLLRENNILDRIGGR